MSDTCVAPLTPAPSSIKGELATTEREVDELEAAINQTTAHGIEVVAHGGRNHDGAVVYAVPSRSQAGMFGEPAPVREEKPDELAARRESAVPARSNAPFSLFKPTFRM
jgi:hypothetical protein